MQTQDLTIGGFFFDKMFLFFNAFICFFNKWLYFDKL